MRTYLFNTHHNSLKYLQDNKGSRFLYEEIPKWDQLDVKERMVDVRAGCKSYPEVSLFLDLYILD